MKNALLKALAILILVFGAVSCGDSDDASTGSGSTFTLKGSDS